MAVPGAFRIKRLITKSIVAIVTSRKQKEHFGSKKN